MQFFEMEMKEEKKLFIFTNVKYHDRKSCQIVESIRNIYEKIYLSFAMQHIVPNEPYPTSNQQKLSVSSRENLCLVTFIFNVPCIWRQVAFGDIKVILFFSIFLSSIGFSNIGLLIQDFTL